MGNKFSFVNLTKINSTKSINILPYALLTLAFIDKKTPINEYITAKPTIGISFSFGWLIWSFQINNL